MMEKVYSKFNSSTVSKCAMNSFNETFPLVRIFLVRQAGEAGTMRIGSKFRNSCLEVLHKNSSSKNSRCSGPVLIKSRNEDL